MDPSLTKDDSLSHQLPVLVRAPDPVPHLPIPEVGPASEDAISLIVGVQSGGGFATEQIPRRTRQVNLGEAWEAWEDDRMDGDG